jgi:hypothetical protein
VTFIVACIAVTAASVAVVQFFIALDRSPRSAAEATWVVKVSHWTARTSRRSYARIAGLRHRRARADVDWSALPGSRPRRAPHVASAAMPLAAPSNGNGLPRPVSALHDRNGVDAAERHGMGATRAGRVPAHAASVPDRSRANGRAHWVWGTRPDFYAESDGSDRLDLEPSLDGQPAGWRTCDEATRKGDLVLVYRMAPRKDLRYLFEAESDAYPVDHRVAPSGGYGCDYRVLHRLDPGISLAELRADPLTGTWQPVRVNFRRSQPVPAEVWDRLAVMIAERDPRAGRVLREKARGPVRRGARIERELENQLFDEPQRLRRIGLDVEAVGHHIRNPDGGLLDMLFRDRLNGDYVVVALKSGRGARATVTRLLEDVASVPDLFETPPSVRGLLIADDLDRRAELMLRGAGNLEFARLEDVGLRRHAGFADSRPGTASPNGEKARPKRFEP